MTQSTTLLEQVDDHVEAHPAADPGRNPWPVAHVIVVVLTALTLAGLLSSNAMVRTAEGMPSGPGKSVATAVAGAFDAVADTVGLSGSRAALDRAFGRDTRVDGVIGESVTLPAATAREGLTSDPSSAGATSGSAGVPKATDESTAASATAIDPPPGRVPTTAKPLRVLVTGDSLSTFVGDSLKGLTAEAGLVDVTQVWFNGSGLSNPKFLNWEAKAAELMVEHKPEVVIMLIGGNDGWNMGAPGASPSGPNSDAWEQEYARRTVAVMRQFTAAGASVYWSGPPTAAETKWNRIFARINSAVATAAELEPRAGYVDLFKGTAVNGRYSATWTRAAGNTVVARQTDGIHFSRVGAGQPALLLLAAMESAHGQLR